MNSGTSTTVSRAGFKASLNAVIGRSGGVVGIVALLLLYSAIWLTLVPYGGLTHDGQAYAIEALVKLKPELFANDIFLSFRSQDEFTVFPNLYAVLIDALGLEVAAAISVFTCQLLWYTMAFLLLRELAGTNLALFGLAVLLTLSRNYGGFQVFHMAESFMTARLPAELLSLAGLWLLFREKWLFSAIVLAFAMAIHPLMAFPAAILAVSVWVAGRFSPRWVLYLLVAGVVVAIAASYLLGMLTDASPEMTGRWLAITVFRSGFLFVNLWRAADWNDTLLALLTLCISATALSSRHARLGASCAVGVALAGLTLATVSSLWLHLEVLIQGQPWRWVWLAHFFAMGLLPATVLALWRGSMNGRTASLLLSAAWLFIVPITARSSLVHVIPALLSGLAWVFWIVRSSVSRDLGRILNIAGWLIFGAVVVSSLVTISLGWELMDKEETVSASAGGGQILSALRFLTPATCIAIAGCAIARVFWTPLRGILVCIAGIALLYIAGPAALNQWLARPYSGEAHAAFADWRAAIPPGSEVLWYDNLPETWFLLERRAYLTRSQSGGIVFSEALADEIVRRALVLEPYIDRNFWFIQGSDAELKPYALTTDTVRMICRDPELGFVVSEDNIGRAAANREWPNPGMQLYLYDCNDFRPGAVG